VLGLTVTTVIGLAAGAGAAIALTHGTNVPGNATATSHTSLTPSQIASRVDPGLVDVAAPLDGGNATDYGTGIVLTSSGEVLTNNHVIEGAKSVSVTDIGNGRTYRGTVVGYDQGKDIAVLRLSGASGLTTAATGDSSTVKTGDSVVGIGNAGGTGGTPSVASGTVTALNRTITATDGASGTSEQLTGMIATNAGIQEGDSGGPLVNGHAQVIGMDTAAFQSGSPSGDGSSASGQAGGAQGTQGFSIPINTALSVAREIEAGQASSTVHVGATAFLGVETAASSGQTASGVTLEGTEPGTPAYNAGLAGGDVITSVAGQQVSSSTNIQQALERYHPGDKVSIAWTGTDGQSHTATLTLASGPAA
jgi:S1-C subfamily serine protease